jgi:hypothetical protein
LKTPPALPLSLAARHLSVPSAHAVGRLSEDVRGMADTRAEARRERRMRWRWRGLIVEVVDGCWLCMLQIGMRWFGLNGVYEMSKGERRRDGCFI